RGPPPRVPLGGGVLPGARSRCTHMYQGGYAHQRVAAVRDWGEQNARGFARWMKLLTLSVLTALQGGWGHPFRVGLARAHSAALGDGVAGMLHALLLAIRRHARGALVALDRGWAHVWRLGRGGGGGGGEGRRGETASRECSARSCWRSDAMRVGRSSPLTGAGRTSGGLRACAGRRRETASRECSTRSCWRSDAMRVGRSSPLTGAGRTSGGLRACAGRRWETASRECSARSCWRS